MNSDAMCWAAANGRTKLVRKLLENKAPISENAMVCAAQNGHTDIARLLLEHKAPICSLAIKWAATADIIEMLGDK